MNYSECTNTNRLDQDGYPKESRRTKLSEEFVRSLPFNSPAVRDSEVKGLMVLCHKRSKSYVVQGDIWRNKRKYKSVRITLGRTDRIALREARGQARALMAAISRGEDPTARVCDLQLTLIEAWDLYQKNGNLAPKTKKEYAGHLNRYLKKLIRVPLVELGENRRIVREIHEHLTKKHGPYAANHALRTFRALYNRALREDPTLPPNPTVAVTFNKESRRDWAMSKEELPAWFEKVQTLSPIFRDLHIFLLFTGLRRNDACTARWENLDSELGTLNIPCPKGGKDRAFTLPLSDYLVQLLDKRKEENGVFFPDSPWIFPSRSALGHVVEPKVKRKGLGWAPHSLRHTYRSLALEASIGYTETSLLLNHALNDVSHGYISRHAVLKHLKVQQERMTAFLLEAIGITLEKVS